MLISKYFVYFIFYSFIGWVYETIFCTIKGAKWENRGFLFGPICPIYGVGADAMMIILDAADYFSLSDYTFEWWQIFLIAFFGSMVLEYVTSYVLEKCFHAVWWDYSRVPLNVNGRICLPASIAFGVAGLIVVYFIIPHSLNLGSGISPVAMEILALIFMAFLAADFTLTVTALTDFENYVISLDESVNRRMDTLVDGIANKAESATAYVSEKRDAIVESANMMRLSKSSLYKSALGRVHHFKYNKIESKKLEELISLIKLKKPKKKK